MTLVSILEESFQVYGESIAVEDSKSSISYKDLAYLADEVRDRLYAFGVRPGDRVGIYLPKSIDAVASILGILRAGAAYVPVDPLAPPSRNAYIFADCGVKAIILSCSALHQLEPELVMPPALVLEQTGGGEGLRQALLEANQQAPAPRLASASPEPDDLAYILYTSGSTGKPKGVMLSHRAALSFINWCSETFEPSPQDRFSSHAPFHFDLSILDIYVPLKHGASLVLIGEELGKDPVRLAAFIAQKQLSIWYSAPSILTMLTQFGKLERHDYSKLRMVLFAGEVFPIKHLRALKSLLPQPRYFNLYGPTETNVCTYYELPASLPENQHKPFPIGKACSHYEIKVFDGSRELSSGEEGELCARGPGVMSGYWNLAERNELAFF
jgi:amino acid adenylation domain-containing protein